MRKWLSLRLGSIYFRFAVFVCGFVVVLHNNGPKIEGGIGWVSGLSGMLCSFPCFFLRESCNWKMVDNGFSD